MYVAIIGASGLIGSHLLKSLIANYQIQKITTLSRSSLETSSKVTQIIIPNMKPSDVATLQIRADIYICCLGTTIKIAKTKENFKQVDFEIVVSFAKLAEKDKAKAFFVISAVGADKNSLIFYNKVKGEMEFAVSQMQIPSVYILRPGLLIGHRKEWRPLEAMGVNFYNFLKSIPYISQGLSSWGTPIEDIVEFINKKIFSLEPGRHIVTKFR